MHYVDQEKALLNKNPQSNTVAPTRNPSFACRSCRSVSAVPFLDLGVMPLTSHLMSGYPIQDAIPLATMYCENCHLVQIRESVSPERLYHQEYPYYSSYSQELLRHSRAHALALKQRLQLSPQSFVVEVASNDGYLLQYFQQDGIPCLGIDPAPGPGKVAQEKGIATITGFFSHSAAQDLKKEFGSADLILANNVVAHVEDINDFVAGLSHLLATDGMVSMEFAYVRDLVDDCLFDTIYHEHLFYYSLASIERLLNRHGLFVHDVERIPIHGGSLRVYAGKDPNEGASVGKLRAAEENAGMYLKEFYLGFTQRVQSVLARLDLFLKNAEESGARVAGYGAAAKGIILLNALKRGHFLEFVVDRNVHKQGKSMPGVNIPIKPVEVLLDEMPDYCLILPWNFRNEIVEQQADYIDRGGSFVIPLPELEVISN